MTTLNAEDNRLKIVKKVPLITKTHHSKNGGVQLNDSFNRIFINFNSSSEQASPKDDGIARKLHDAEQRKKRNLEFLFWVVTVFPLFVGNRYL